MKRLLSILSCLVLGAVLMLPAAAYADEANIYAPFSNFEELYDAYMEAIEDGDTERQEWLLEIGESSLDKLIDIGEAAAASTPQPMYNDDLAYWISQFPKYFSYGGWKTGAQGINLALRPINNVYWSASDMENGWNATYSKFYDDPQWDNTNCMKAQFYCHARRPIAAQGEWNLEPWRTSIDPIFCN